MNLVIFLCGLFLVILVADGFPVENDIEGDISFPKTEEVELKEKIREKRKSDDKASMVDSITADKPAESAVVKPLDVVQEEENAKENLPPSMHLEKEEGNEIPAVRAKKHTCPKELMAVGKAAMMEIPRTLPSDLVFFRNEPIEYVPVSPQHGVVRSEPMEYIPINIQPKAMAKANTRTIGLEPIISLGPVSVNSQDDRGIGSSSYTNGMPIVTTSVLGQTSYAPSSSFNYRPLYQPGYQQGYQQGHHHPLVQHTINLRQPSYLGLGPVIYYDRQSDVVAQEVAAPVEEPVSLYCQPLKSSELVKALTPQEHAEPAVKKLNESEHLDEAAHHIKKVNQIQEEITQLNRAAQRLVEQQESLAKMQQEHMARAAGSMYPAPMYRPPHDMRMPPYHPMYHGYPMMRPMYPYRSEDGMRYDDTATQAPLAPMQSNKPEKLIEQDNAKPSMPERPYQKVPLARTETGFDVPSLLMKGTQATSQISKEDISNFLKLLQSQQSTMQPAKLEEGKHAIEDAVTDLMEGPRLMSHDNPEAKQSKTKRDSRGLVN